MRNQASGIPIPSITYEIIKIGTVPIFTFKMNNIKDLIPGVIGDLAKKQPQQVDLAALWQRICGNAKGSKIYEIKNGHLTVMVDSSARKMQLFRKRQELLEELQNKVPTIKTIYFKVGSV